MLEDYVFNEIKLRVIFHICSWGLYDNNYCVRCCEIINVEIIQSEAPSQKSKKKEPFSYYKRIYHEVHILLFYGF